MFEKVKTVTAILYNSQREVLLYQRDNKPNLPYAGYWSTLGGVLEEGETPIEAIQRELVEEIESEPLVEFWKDYEWNHSSNIVVHQYVFVGYFDQPLDKIALNEGQALAYFGELELDSLPIGFGFKELLHEFYQTFDLKKQV